jgi:isoleucyl-tRNA synthetase
MSEAFFQPVNTQIRFPAVEEEVLDFWRQRDVFGESLRQRATAPAFTFYDGPPFATGLPHYGHLLAGTLKDIVPRYWTMRGYAVSRRFGWDCHGLPIESLVQKMLDLASVHDIRTFGVGRFNEACRENVLTYTREWRRTVERMGRWVDFDNDYKTMDAAFMESVWWVFKQCFDRGLIYQDYRIQPYSPALATPLSNFEVNQGYRDRQDPALTMRFALEDGSATILVWTTTPWTLPSNLAIAVNPQLDYVLARIPGDEQCYWVAKNRREAVLGDSSEILQECKGAALAGKRYVPLFTFAPQLSDKQYSVVCADFVSAEEGTGAVHIAPSFGEDDFVLGKREGLGLFDPLDAEGRFGEAVPLFAGVEAKEADKQIIAHLKAAGRVFKHDTIMHSYPHCWRTDVPLLYRALKTWFLSIDAPVTNDQGVQKPLKQWMLESNQQINWVPDHIKNGRFGKWLEGARDWNLGRNRFWGTPIPVWVAQDGDTLCVGSVEQLQKLTGSPVTDLHMHVVDTLELRTSDKVTFDPQGKLYVRTPEVLDCWFESGAMPYAQLHYPFEHGQDFEQRFPADFIAEGIDQTRGWFYTLSVLGAALFQKPPFRNVIVNGTILAEDGQKMSKRLRNYTPPDDVMHTLGADAMRLFLINSPAVRAEDLRFSDVGVTEMARSILLPFWNAYAFFVTYANVDGFSPQQAHAPGASTNELDRWIVSLLNDTIAKVNQEMEQYNLFRVVPLLVDFIDNLTNWYIRRSRRRFWKSENDIDKADAYSTLYHVLVEFATVMAPFLPFLTEAIYRNLKGAQHTQALLSVHLRDYPQADPALIDEELDTKMAMVRQAVAMGRALRSRFTIKTRQPLAEFTVVIKDERKRALLQQMEHLIAEELNVKTVVFSAAEDDVVHVSVKPNYKRLGRVFGPRMKEAAAIVEALDGAQISALEQGEPLEVLGQTLCFEDVEIRRSKKSGLEVETEGQLTVALNTELSAELLAEGLAREFVNRVQNIRKEHDFNVADRIEVSCCCADGLREALESFRDYVCSETLTTSLSFVDSLPQGAQAISINDSEAQVHVQRAQS